MPEAELLAPDSVDALARKLNVPAGVFSPNEGSFALARAALDRATPDGAARDPAALGHDGEFLEVGCGCGIVSIWLVQHGCRGVAVDAAPLAVHATGDNVARLRSQGRLPAASELAVEQSDLLEAIDGTFPLILFNPGSQSAADDGSRQAKDGLHRLLPAWTKPALSRLYQRANQRRRRAFLSRFFQQAAAGLRPSGLILVNLLHEDVAWASHLGRLSVVEKLSRTSVVELRPRG